MRDGGRAKGAFKKLLGPATQQGADGLQPGAGLATDSIGLVRHQPPIPLAHAAVVAPLVPAGWVPFGTVHARHLGVQGDGLGGAQVITRLGLGQRVGRAGRGHEGRGLVAAHVPHRGCRGHDGSHRHLVAGRGVVGPAVVSAVTPAMGQAGGGGKSPEEEENNEKASENHGISWDPAHGIPVLGGKMVHQKNKKVK